LESRERKKEGREEGRKKERKNEKKAKEKNTNLLFCFLSLLPLCFSVSFAVFSPVGILLFP